MTIEEQLQHLKDLRAILSDIKQHALAPGAYRASDRDAIQSLLSIGLPLIRDLIEENTGLPPLEQEPQIEDDISPEDQELARIMSESMVPNLFPLPAPPEHLTPQMAQQALRRLITQDQQLGQETVKVMMGVHQIDQTLGTQMVGFIPKYFAGYQGEIKDIIDQLEGMKQEGEK